MSDPDSGIDGVDHDPEDTPFERIKSWMDATDAMFPNTFDVHVRRNVELLSATIDSTDPTIAHSTFLLKVVPEICNATGNLHGGFVALAFDMCTSLTISPLVREDFWDVGHVSRTLNCTYLRPAPIGSEVLIESDTVHLGKRLGLLRGRMRMKSTGKLLYTCEHDKAAIETRLDPAEETEEKEEAAKAKL